MADNESILVTGAAGQLGAVGRTVTGLLLDRGLPVRAMVRREDDRGAALRAAGAEVVVGDLLEPADVYRVVSGCRRVYFGMSVSAGYLEASVTMAAVTHEVGVDALVNMSQMTVSQMSIQNTTPSPQQRQHWLSEQALLGTHAARIASGASKFFSRAGVRTVAACSLYSHKAGDRPPPAYAKPSGVSSWRSFCSSIANPRRAAPSHLLRKCRLCRRPGTHGCKSSARPLCPAATD